LEIKIKPTFVHIAATVRLGSKRKFAAAFTNVGIWHKEKLSGYHGYGCLPPYCRRSSLAAMLLSTTTRPNTDNGFKGVPKTPSSKGEYYH